MSDVMTDDPLVITVVAVVVIGASVDVIVLDGLPSVSVALAEAEGPSVPVGVLSSVVVGGTDVSLAVEDVVGSSVGAEIVSDGVAVGSLELVAEPVGSGSGSGNPGKPTIGVVGRLHAVPAAVKSVAYWSL